MESKNNRWLQESWVRKIIKDIYEENFPELKNIWLVKKYLVQQNQEKEA